MKTANQKLFIQWTHLSEKMVNKGILGKMTSDKICHNFKGRTLGWREMILDGYLNIQKGKKGIMNSKYEGKYKRQKFLSSKNNQWRSAVTANQPILTAVLFLPADICKGLKAEFPRNWYTVSWNVGNYN